MPPTSSDDTIPIAPGRQPARRPSLSPLPEPNYLAITTLQLPARCRQPALTTPSRCTWPPSSLTTESEPTARAQLPSNRYTATASTMPPTNLTTPSRCTRPPSSLTTESEPTARAHLPSNHSTQQLPTRSHQTASKLQSHTTTHLIAHYKPPQTTEREDPTRSDLQRGSHATMKAHGFCMVLHTQQESEEQQLHHR